MKELIKQFLGVALGVFLIAFSVKTLFAPHDIAAGGVGGIAIIAQRAMGISMGLTSAVINLALLGVGLLFLGKGFFVRTVIGATLFPVFVQFIPDISLTSDVLLSVLFGSFLTAAGVQILYSLDASSGGTTIPPMILKKLFGLNPSIGLLATDAIVVLLSLLVFGIESLMYSTLVIVLTSIIMEYLSAGFSRKKSVFIISDKHEEISQTIIKRLGRGVTKIPAIGAYTKNNKELVMVILSERDLNIMNEIVENIDKQAFIVVQNVASVTGEGFTYHSVVE